MKSIFAKNKQVLLCFIFIFHISFCLFSQDVGNKEAQKNKKEKFKECMTSDSAIDKKTLKYYGNNKYLMKVLKENKINIDTAYYDDPEIMKKYRNSNISYNATLYSSTTTFQYIPIKVWVHRKTDGSNGLDETSINIAISYLNDFYSRQSNIRLYRLCDISYVDNDSYYENPSNSQVESMFDNYWMNGVLNVHFIYNSNQFGGIAHLPSISKPYSAAVCWGQPNYANALCHEVGHMLGLLHTHEHYLVDRCVQESVSRTRLQELGCHDWQSQSKNCDVNGDYLCDTQSDPDLSNYSRNGCNYYGLGNDYWGDAFQTDASNIMSYAYRDCRTSFTLSQIAIMNDNLPSGTTTTGPLFSISGPNTVCTGQSGTFTINSSVSGSNTYNWSIPSGWNISGQGSTTVILTAPNSYGGVIQVTPSCGSVGTSKTIYPPVTSLSISGQNQLCPNSYYYFNTQDTPGVYYNWSVQGNASITSGQGQSGIQIYTNSNFNGGQVQVSANNSCTNLSVNTSQTLQPNYSCGGRIAAKIQIREIKEPSLLVYPNPASTSIKVIDSSSASPIITVYDLQGKVLNLPIAESPQLEKIIDTSKLKSGVYIIKSETEFDRKTKKFIIN